MRRPLFALSALAFVATPALGKDAPVVLAPQSEWEIIADGDTCTAARLFAKDGQVHLLKLEQYAPSTAVGLSAFGPAFRAFINLQPTELRFREDQKPHKASPFTGVLPGFDKGVIYGAITPNWDELAALAKGGTPPAKPYTQLDDEAGERIAFVGLQQGGRPEVRLATGSMRAVFQSLNGCTFALLEKWGLDAERFRTAQRRPSLQGWRETWDALRDAYRSNALQGERGVIVLRATISAEGKMESCALLDAATSGNLAPAICDVMGKAKFAPAIDAAGQPFRAPYVQTLKFQTS